MEIMYLETSEHFPEVCVLGFRASRIWLGNATLANHDGQALCEQIRGEGGRAVAVDMSNIEKLDSSGLAVLVAILVSCRRAGVPIVYCGSSEPIMALMKLCRLDILLAFAPDVQLGALLCAHALRLPAVAPRRTGISAKILPFPRRCGAGDEDLAAFARFGRGLEVNVYASPGLLARTYGHSALASAAPLADALKGLGRSERAMLPEIDLLWSLCPIRVLFCLSAGTVQGEHLRSLDNAARLLRWPEPVYLVVASPGSVDQGINETADQPPQRSSLRGCIPADTLLGVLSQAQAHLSGLSLSSLELLARSPGG
jgi:anti-anti-sigma factor